MCCWALMKLCVVTAELKVICSHEEEDDEKRREPWTYHNKDKNCIATFLSFWFGFPEA